MATGGPPKGQKAPKKAVNIGVPDLREDAAERKRVLNVLAQRRYRKRKREHVEALESQLRRAPGQHSERVESPSAPVPVPELQQDREHGAPETYSNPPVVDLQQGTDFGIFPDFDTEVELPAPPAMNLLPTGFSPPAPSPGLHPSSFDHEIATCLARRPASQRKPWSWDPSLLLPCAKTRSPSPSLNISSSSSSNHSSSSPSTYLSTPSDASFDFSPRLQALQTATFTFPDDRVMDSLELKLLRGSMMIARRLNIAHILFNIGATSPFSSPSGPISSCTDFSHLPPNLRPTPIQLAIKHHPMMDLFPWPNVRNKLIAVFSQEPEYRPPSAAGPNAMLELIYDLEDPAKGVRIWGDDPFDGENWEVGKKLFDRWWWALDSEVVANSNKLRTKRGAPRLVIGEILGEVS